MTRVPINRRHAFWRLFRSNLVFIGLFAIAAFFLLTEHLAHTLGFLPFLLLALCPLMHMFGHNHGHGGNTNDSHQEDRTEFRP